MHCQQEESQVAEEDDKQENATADQGDDNMGMDFSMKKKKKKKKPVGDKDDDGQGLLLTGLI